MESSTCNADENSQIKPPCIICRREIIPRIYIRDELLIIVHLLFSTSDLKKEHRFICTNCMAVIMEIHDVIVFAKQSIEDTINQTQPDPDMKLPNLLYTVPNKTYKSDYKPELNNKVTTSPEVAKAPAMIETTIALPHMSRAENLLYEPEPVLTVIRCDCHQRGFPNRAALATHERSVRRQRMQLKRARRISVSRANSDIEYPCVECDQTFSSRYYLKKHNTRVHAMKYVCRLCEKAEFYNNNDREFHEATCSERFLDTSGDSVQTRSRSRLGRIYRSQSARNLDANQSFVSIEKDLDLASCYSGRSSRSGRRRGRPSKVSQSHIVNHIQWDKSNVLPNEPDSSFDSNRDETLEPPVPWRVNSEQDLTQLLVDYSTYTKPRKKNQCTECDYSTYNIDTLCRHEIRKHNKVAWFPCRECHLSYTNKQQLEVHVERQHYSGPFVCNRCTDCFPSQRELQTHFQFHKTEYICHKCDLRFTDMHAFREHWRCTRDPFHLTEKNIQFLVTGAMVRSRSPSEDSNASYGITISEVTSLCSDSRCSSPVSELSMRSSTPFPDYDTGSFSSERSSTPFPRNFDDDDEGDDDDDNELMCVTNNDAEMPEYSSEIITFDDHCFRMLTNIDNDRIINIDDDNQNC